LVARARLGQVTGLLGNRDLVPSRVQLRLEARDPVVVAARLSGPNEYETLADAREPIAAYIADYHDRPNSGLGYRTPNEVAATWSDDHDLQSPAA